MERQPGNFVDPPSTSLDEIGRVMFPGDFPEGCRGPVLDQFVAVSAAFPIPGKFLIDRGECLPQEVTPFALHLGQSGTYFAGVPGNTQVKSQLVTFNPHSVRLPSGER